MEEAIRNLHMDMISQFYQQSQEINTTLASKLESIARLTEENDRLRAENEYLKTGDRKPM
jgi:regulator of replication initiation timing